MQRLKLLFLCFGTLLVQHTHTLTEFVKKNITDVVAVLDPNNKKLQRLIAQMPCLRRTTQRRIS